MRLPFALLAACVLFAQQKPPAEDPPELKALIDSDTAEVLRRINAVGPYEIPDLLLKKEQNYANTPADIEPYGAVKPYKPVGCLECRMTGFRGRAGLYELLTVSDAARACIHPVPDAAKLRHQALQDGMRPLRLAGAMKVAEGVTTLAEVLRTTPAWE